MKEKNNPHTIFFDGGVFFEKMDGPGNFDDEIVFDKRSGKQIPRIQSSEFLGNFFTYRRARIFLIFLCVVMLSLFSRLVWLQIWKGEVLLAQSEGNRERAVPIVAERGLIYDRNGIQLTKNIPNFSLAITPQDLEREKVNGRNQVSEKIIERLALLTQKDQESIRSILTEYGNYSYDSIVIQENLDYDTALKLHIASQDLPGVHIERSSKRLYLHHGEGVSSFTSSTDSSISHVLGYLGKLNRQELDSLRGSGYLPSDSIGKLGVEKSYESSLRGVYGKRRVEVDTRGREQRVLSEEPPSPGLHLYLSIDAKMQSKLEEIIKNELEKQGKKRAAGVVLDPQNGKILALVNVPSFDNNDFSGGISTEKYKKYIENQDRPLFNRAIAGGYPSGSSIKPVIALAALSEGVISASTSFLSSGGLQVGQWFFPDWRTGGHGNTDVRFSLADSVNTFYYYIGGGFNNFEGLGVDRIKLYLEKFGFGRISGIDIPGETGGFVPSAEWKQEKYGERWYIGDTYNLSIGQGDLLTTPLQIALMTGSIASDGTLYRPSVVSHLENPVTKKLEVVKPEILVEQIADQENLRLIQLGMRDCVLIGSCRRLASLPFAVAGKTGTAQWNSNFPPHAWFTSFAPFENPEIVVTILVEEGKEGSAISVSIAEQFYRWWGSYRAI